ncbi:endonuclease/exonuclease/phosphatase family protein [Parabacteroides bouchesdurhonensis]|uniref:endonuclease/exonuclease/phosphatase family protein n=1 Tax=Parabacteroides bouchesdurhonensis TaxID=1936995 RepID=UPI000E4E6B26|nr:endonuclease/exonuclease/phosphatase family protein [Parabacteroides bouchesdurhonensis]RHJ94943.1 endonuclease [Bacteroides sp. AM07-16]
MKKIIYGILFLFCVSWMMQAGKPMVVATYNLRYANEGDSAKGNGWGQRYPYIAQLIQFHGFDIFGTQEGLYHQLEDLKKAMPAYDYIGIGRDDGKLEGEHSAIFYRTDKFEVLEHGDFWLSTITDRPNKGWDAVLPRICTWGKFRDKETGFTFLFFNLHMDHVGVQARAESAKLILSKIRALPEQLPVILTGDFNVSQKSDAYKLLDSSGILRDSYEIADFRYAPNGTFNGFHTDRKTGSRIDHLFLTNDFEVLKYGILTDTYRSEIQGSEVEEKNGNFPKEVSMQKYRARTPSDHFPVMIVVEPKN